MECQNCKKEMKGNWCDDGMHEPGMFYECSCGKNYFSGYDGVLTLI